MIAPTPFHVVDAKAHDVVCGRFETRAEAEKWVANPPATNGEARTYKIINISKQPKKTKPLSPAEKEAAKAIAAAADDGLDIPDYLKRPHTPESRAAVEKMIKDFRENRVVIRRRIDSPKDSGTGADGTSTESSVKASTGKSSKMPTFTKPVSDTTITAAKMAMREEGTNRTEINPIRHGGNDYWRKVLSTYAKKNGLEFVEEMKESEKGTPRPQFFLRDPNAKPVVKAAEPKKAAAEAKAKKKKASPKAEEVADVPAPAPAKAKKKKKVADKGGAQATA